MANSLNQVQLIGNLTRDPEQKSTPSGSVVTTLGIATSHKWKNKTTGELQEETEFSNVVVWGRAAEACGQYLNKGSKIYVSGRLKTRSWDDRNTGAKQYRTEVVAEEVIFLDGRGSQSPAPAAPQRAAAPAPATEEINVEDLPF